MDTRFAAAIHLLVLISSPHGRGLSAERMARSVGTHPVRVRQILAALARAGMSETRRGRTGGTVLARPADAISLGDVYHAIYDDPELLPLHADPDPRCPVGGAICLALLAPFAMAEATMVDALRTTSIATVAASVAASVATTRARRRLREERASPVG
jgi:Rrf2 family protein